MPNISYYNGETVGDYSAPADTYKQARDVPRRGVQGVNWYGSQWQVQNAIAPATHARNQNYDFTAVARQYSLYANRKAQIAPPLLADYIPAYALPNVALMAGNYQPTAPNKTLVERGLTTLYRKVK
jgi:hypothetical protein